MEGRKPYADARSDGVSPPAGPRESAPPPAMYGLAPAAFAGAGTSASTRQEASSGLGAGQTWWTFAYSVPGSMAWALAHARTAPHPRTRIVAPIAATATLAPRTFTILPCATRSRGVRSAARARRAPATQPRAAPPRIRHARSAHQLTA